MVQFPLHEVHIFLLHAHPSCILPPILHRISIVSRHTPHLRIHYCVDILSRTYHESARIPWAKKWWHHGAWVDGTSTSDDNGFCTDQQVCHVVYGRTQLSGCTSSLPKCESRSLSSAQNHRRKDLSGIWYAIPLFPNIHSGGYRSLRSSQAYGHEATDHLASTSYYHFGGSISRGDEFIITQKIDIIELIELWHDIEYIFSWSHWSSLILMRHDIDNLLHIGIGISYNCFLPIYTQYTTFVFDRALQISKGRRGYDKTRWEMFYRQIIRQDSIDEFATSESFWYEYSWNRDRGTDGLSKISLTQNDIFPSIDVACNDGERNFCISKWLSFEKLVEEFLNLPSFQKSLLQVDIDKLHPRDIRYNRSHLIRSTTKSEECPDNRSHTRSSNRYWWHTEFLESFDDANMNESTSGSSAECERKHRSKW